MIEWIVSGSVLIGIVFLLRAVLNGRISLRLRYLLWLPVLKLQPQYPTYLTAHH